VILEIATLIIAGIALGLAVSSAIQARDAARFWTEQLATRIENFETPTIVESDASPPPCPRCGKPCHKVAVPIEPGDPNWVWGHDCDPLA
jgi:hypothetical protein